MRRTIAAALLALSLLAICTPAHARTEPNTKPDTPTWPAPTFPYGQIETARWWNQSHDPNLTADQTVALTAYLNGIVYAAIGDYLFVVWLNALPDTRTCSSPSSCAELVRSVFSGRGLDGAAAVSVASCESGLDPNARNPSGASGLFQHLISYWPARAAGAGYPGASPFDPYVNTLAAANMVAASGWSAWVCKP